MKYSINNTFSAEKINTYPKHGGEPIDDYIRIKSTKNATAGIMFRDKSVNIITANISVYDFKELCAFLEWICENYWNI